MTALRARTRLLLSTGCRSIVQFHQLLFLVLQILKMVELDVGAIVQDQEVDEAALLETCTVEGSA